VVTPNEMPALDLADVYADVRFRAAASLRWAGVDGDCLRHRRHAGTEWLASRFTRVSGNELEACTFISPFRDSF